MVKVIIEVELNTEDEDEVIGVKEAIANLVEPWHDISKPVKVTVIDPKKEQAEIEALFNEFWAEYPRKVGKVVAFKAFKKECKNRKMLETMLEALRKQKKLKQWQNVEYIPHPSVWLNGRRWEDELGAVVEPQGDSSASYDLNKFKQDSITSPLVYRSKKERAVNV